MDKKGQKIMKTVAERINEYYVMTRTKSGAPRKFLAKRGEVNKSYRCQCANAGHCSHEQALYALLSDEAATVQAQPVIHYHVAT